MNYEYLQSVAGMMLDAGRCPNHLMRQTTIGGKEVFDYKSTQMLLALTMARGVACGMDELTAAYSVMWLNDKPCLWGDAAWALVLRSDDLTHYTEKHDEEKREYSVTLHRGGIGQEDGSIKGGTSLTRTFSFQDASRAGLDKLDHYQRYEVRMLMIRARSWAMRDLFADVLNGMSIAEEQQDVEILKQKPEKQKYADMDKSDEFTSAALSKEVITYHEVKTATPENIKDDLPTPMFSGTGGKLSIGTGDRVVNVPQIDVPEAETVSEKRPVKEKRTKKFKI